MKKSPHPRTESAAAETGQDIGQSVEGHDRRTLATFLPLHASRFTRLAATRRGARGVSAAHLRNINNLDRRRARAAALGHLHQDARNSVFRQTDLRAANLLRDGSADTIAETDRRQ